MMSFYFIFYANTSHSPTTEQLKNTSIVSTLFSGSAIAKQQRNIKLRERELTQRIHRVNQLDKMIKRMRTKKILTEVCSFMFD